MPSGPGSTLGRALAVLLFAALAAVYALSVPGAFNTVFRNERFFGSDGEFITRQFREGATYTHNDHLLYHVAATVLADVGLPGIGDDAVAVHKLLSVLAGAAGVSLLFLFGHRYGGRLGPALILALLVAGTSSYWFFASTIDTYLPGVFASILSLGLALRCVRDQRMASYGALGAAMGLAFLLRTDGFLLAPLAGVALLAPERRLRRVGASLAAAGLVGGVGYAVLARAFYDVPPAEVASFALGHQERKRVEKGKWARAKNLRPRHLEIVLANHLVYGIVLPDLSRTRNPRVLQRMAKHRYGPFTLGVLAAFAVFMAVEHGRRGAAAVRARNAEPLVLLGVALCWLLVRVVFYTWWDPFDPFLFAVTSVPALWLLALLFVAPSGTAPERAPAAALAAAAVLGAAVWIHNWIVLIQPLRRLAG